MEVRRGPIRMLVVDDSTVALDSICRFLKLQPNVEVVGTAADGWEGLASARALRPDLVLLDLQMPVMNGIEAAARLRHEHPAIRIIIMTVHDTPQVREACRDSGADGFVPKDHLAQELPTLLEQLLASEEPKTRHDTHRGRG